MKAKSVFLLGAALIAAACAPVIRHPDSASERPTGPIALAPDPDLPGGTGQYETLGEPAWIIPMDNFRQSKPGVPSPVFNMKAYGLINRLLWAGIPLKWAIRPDKKKILDPVTLAPIDEPDFRAEVFPVKPVPDPNAVETIDFYAGPFIIPIKFTKQAGVIIDNFNSQHPNEKVSVYQVHTTTKVWVRYDLTHKPKVIVLNARPITLPFQRILDRTGGFAPGNEYIVVNPSTTASLPSNGCYTMIVAPHTEPGWVTDGIFAGVSMFVHNGGNFLAQCLALDIYENNPQTRAQTNMGVTVSNQNSHLEYDNPALAFSQFHGALNEDEADANIQDWAVPGGVPADFINDAHVHVRNLKKPFSLAATASKFNVGQVGSLTFYLGGHDYTDDNNQRRINGLRMLLNAIMMPAKGQNCP